MIRSAWTALLLAVAPAAGPAAPLPPPTSAADEVWNIDQIRLAGLSDPARLDALRADHSMAAVADHLRRLGLRFTRAPVSLRPADLPGGLVAQLRALPPGEPFILPADGIVTVNARVASPAPMATEPVWSPAIKGEPSAAQLAAARRFIDAAIPPAERAHFFDEIVDATIVPLMGRMLQTTQIRTALQAHPALRPILGQFAGHQRELALADMHAHLPQLIEAQVIAYARLFSVDELDRLAGFFAQPLGRKYLQQTLLLSTQPELAAWQQGMIARVQARAPAEVQQLMTNIQAALAKEKGNDVF